MHTVWYVLAGEERRGLLREVITIVLQQIVPTKIKIINNLKRDFKKEGKLTRRHESAMRCQSKIVESPLMINLWHPVTVFVQVAQMEFAPRFSRTSIRNVDWPQLSEFLRDAF